LVVGKYANQEIQTGEKELHPDVYNMFREALENLGKDNIFANE